MNCMTCGRYTTNTKFCDRSCSAKTNNQRRKKEKFYNCLNCNKLTLFTHRKKNLYCSNSCQGEHKFKTETIPKILQGKVSCPKILKRYLSITKENCVLCGLGSFWNGEKLSLQLDHIDGNSDNNFPENLRLLCPNCHSQTDTFAGKLRVKKESKRNRYLRKFKGYE